MNNKSIPIFKHFDFYFINLLSLLAGFTISYCTKFDRHVFSVSSQWQLFLVINILINLVIILFASPYSGILRRQYYEDIFNIFQVAVFSLITIGIVLFFLKSGATYSRYVVFMTYGIYCALDMVLECIWKALLVHGVIKISSAGLSSIFVISTSDRVSETVHNIKASDIQLFEIKGIFLTDDGKLPEDLTAYPLISPSESAVDLASAIGITDVVMDLPIDDFSRKLCGDFMAGHISVHFSLDAFLGLETENQQISQLGILRSLNVSGFAFSAKQKVYLIVKRFLDVIIGLFGCICMLPIALIVKLFCLFTGDSHSIFYTQERVGKDGRHFKMFKFRSMVPDAEKVLEELLKDEAYRTEWEENQKFENDPRITKLGRFLRKSSLDEVPQFINVLKGDMSFIGPRPLVPGELEAHGGLPIYNSIKPGITGWWGCNGRSNIDYRERLDLEYYYIKHCSMLLDIVCIIRTVFVVIKKEGAK